MLVTLKEKRKKRKSKQRLVYQKNLEPYFSAKSPPYLPTYKNAIPSIVYVPCLYIQKFLFIVQFEVHGKVAVYGEVHLCKLHVCHFINWG
jgi:hypothetical protein